MSRKWIFTAVLLVVLGTMALPAWNILSGHNYQADAFWNTHNAEDKRIIDHSLWQEILDDYLISDDPSGINLVDYEALLDDDFEKLEEYLKRLESLDIRQYAKGEQFAYWVNLYNALTVKVILDNFPLESIKQISGAGLASGPWDNKLLSIQGHEVSLNDIEHRILRPIWKDYRIHFAVNCASIGCPNLAPTAFTSINYEELLNQAAESYLQHARAFQLSNNRLTLSSIFNWYQTDFGATETEMLNTISRHLIEADRERLAQFSGEISYEYDWSLNSYNLAD